MYRYSVSLTALLVCMTLISVPFSLAQETGLYEIYRPMSVIGLTPDSSDFRNYLRNVHFHLETIEIGESEMVWSFSIWDQNTGGRWNGINSFELDTQNTYIADANGRRYNAARLHAFPVRQGERVEFSLSFPRPSPNSTLTLRMGTCIAPNPYQGYWRETWEPVILQTPP